MNTRILANQLLETFGRTLTVEGLQLGEEDNSCVLLFDGELALTIEHDEPAERLVFSVHLDTLNHEPAEPLLRELLSANFYWIATGGATLCLESSTGSIFLIYATRVADLDDARFEKTVESLLTMAERWRERLAAHRAGEVARESASDNGAGTLALSDRNSIFG